MVLIMKTSQIVLPSDIIFDEALEIVKTMFMSLNFSSCRKFFTIDNQSVTMGELQEVCDKLGAEAVVDADLSQIRLYR